MMRYQNCARHQEVFYMAHKVVNWEKKSGLAYPLTSKLGEVLASVRLTDYFARYITRKTRNIASVQKTIVPAENVRDITPVIP